MPTPPAGRREHSVRLLLPQWDPRLCGTRSLLALVPGFSTSCNMFVGGGGGRPSCRPSCLPRAWWARLMGIPSAQPQTRPETPAGGAGHLASGWSLQARPLSSWALLGRRGAVPHGSATERGSLGGGGAPLGQNQPTRAHQSGGPPADSRAESQARRLTRATWGQAGRASVPTPDSAGTHPVPQREHPSSCPARRRPLLRAPVLPSALRAARPADFCFCSLF